VKRIGRKHARGSLNVGVGAMLRVLFVGHGRRARKPRREPFRVNRAFATVTRLRAAVPRFIRPTGITGARPCRTRVAAARPSRPFRAGWSTGRAVGGPMAAAADARNGTRGRDARGSTPTPPAAVAQNRILDAHHFYFRNDTERTRRVRT